MNGRINARAWLVLALLLVAVVAAPSEAVMLGTSHFSGGGGTPGYQTDVEFSFGPAIGYTGPAFRVSWHAGLDDVGDTLVASGETDADFEILVSILTNGVADRIGFLASGGGQEGTDCSFFTKASDVGGEYCDFCGSNITAVSLTVYALTLDHPTDSWTDYSYDVTVTVWGEPGEPRLAGGISC